MSSFFLRLRSTPLTRRALSLSLSLPIPIPIRTSITITPRDFTSTSANMGVTKTIIKEGSGEVTPQPGQAVTIEYTGWLKDTSGGKGSQFDSSVGRGDFVTKIGVGKVIKGWDEGVVTMKVGEKATLDISPDYAYGAQGFPPVIPANSTLLFDVELKKID